MKETDSYLKKWSLSDYELQNVGINFSIIKHNEFKSLNVNLGTKQNPVANKDISVECMDFEVVSDLRRS